MGRADCEDHVSTRKNNTRQGFGGVPPWMAYDKQRLLSMWQKTIVREVQRTHPLTCWLK